MNCLAKFYYYTDSDLKRILTLLKVSRTTYNLVNYDSRFWSLYLEKDDIKKTDPAISYSELVKQRYYSKLSAIIESKHLSPKRKQAALIQEGKEHLSSARLMVAHPMFRKFFLKHNMNKTHTLYENLECICDIGCDHESIALFLVKDSEFREALLKYEYGSIEVVLLATAHTSVARFIIQNDPELTDAITEDEDSIIEIISKHEEIFLAFFKNETYKARCLNYYPPHFYSTIVSDQVFEIGEKFNVLDSNDRRKSPHFLMERIMERLLARQALNENNSESSTNTPGLSR